MPRPPVPDTLFQGTVLRASGCSFLLNMGRLCGTRKDAHAEPVSSLPLKIGLGTPKAVRENSRWSSASGAIAVLAQNEAARKPPDRITATIASRQGCGGMRSNEWRKD